MSKGLFARLVSTATFCAALALTLLTASPAHGQTPTTIYTFPGGSGNPANPNNNSVAQGRNGNFYFTTCVPLSIESVMFDISATEPLTSVYTPSNCSYGVTAGTDGNLYSTTGNNDGAGGLYGTVYKVTPTGTATTLHTFTNGVDGSYPYLAPIEAVNGIFYGTTQAQVTNSTAYSVTSSGTFTTLHTFTGTDGQNVNGLVQGSDGNFYGSSQSGGTDNLGVIYKMTATGTVTVLHNFAGSDGAVGRWNLMQAKDGNFYGVTLNGGTSGGGVLYRITSTGTYTVLYNFPLTGNPSTGTFPYSGLIQATNGLLYGVTGNTGGPWAFGAIYSFNPVTLAYTTLYSFTGGTDGGQPIGPLLQNTDGLLYGTTYVGGNVSGSGFCNTVEYDGELVGVGGCGTVFTENIGAAPFIELQETSGKVGSQVGILGQGFSKSSVVKFNGTAVTKATLTGTTFIAATVPAGATDGFVTVTTGSTTLTSPQKYTVHNSWASGAAMPTAVNWPVAGVIGTKAYVVGGYTGGPATADNQVYNLTTNVWTSGAALPAATAQAAAAVAGNVLYVFGGSDNGGSTVFNTVWAYSPATNSWSSKTAMPTARCSAVAVFANKLIYVIGGFSGGNRLDTVEAYNPATDTWTEEAPLLNGKSEISAGLIGSTIVAAGGFTSGGDNGDNEGYKIASNTWTSLASDPTARNGSCSGAIGSLLYVADGNTGGNGPVSLMESFNLAANKWTTLTAMPQTVTDIGSAVSQGQLYCFGGGNYAVPPNNTVYNYVQIYQP